MTDILDTQAQSCTANNTTFHVEKPCMGSNASISLSTTEPTYFDFGLQDISGMQMLEGGMLLITFIDGQTLTVDNYAQAIQTSQFQDIQLSDGEVINLAKLAEGLSSPSNMTVADASELNGIVPASGEEFVNLLSKPNGEMDTKSLDYTMVEGETYVADFAQDEIASTQMNEQGQLVITFTDNTQTIITNYADIDGVSDIPQMTLADGTTIPVTDLLNVTAIDAVAQNTDVDKVAQEIAFIEPAAGDIAQKLASIEPAAGDTAPAGVLGNTGANFGSSISGGGVGNNSAVGPIDPTALQFGAPELRDDKLFFTLINPPILVTNEALGYEDNAINFAVFAQPSLTDGSQSITVTISDIPAGWTPVLTDPDTAAGVFDPIAGTWTISLSPGDILSSGPIFTPPTDSDVNIEPLSVTVVQTDIPTGTVTTKTNTFNVIVDAVADDIDLNATNVSGFEDNPIALNIQAGLHDTDGSEEITSVTITGVPFGFSLNHGVYNQGNGTWTINSSDLPLLELTAPADYSGTVTLGVVVVNEEVNLSDSEFDLSNNDNTTTTSFDVTFAPVPDAPSLIVNNPIVKEDGSITLDVSATLQDTDGSETLTVTISNLDASWGVNAGINNGVYDAGTGTWTITMPAGSDYAGSLTLTPPADSDVDMTNIQVSATSTESDGTTSTISTLVDVVTDAVADMPTLTLSNVNGVPGTSYALNISNAVTDTDGSESLGNVTISGLPAGFSLSAGTDLGGGVWEVSQGDLSGLMLHTPASYNGSFALNVSVTTTDTPTDTEVDFTDNTATVTDTLNVNLNFGTINPPIANIDGSHQVLEDGSVFVDFTASLSTNAAPSEVLTVTLTGIDSSWSVNAGINNGVYDAGTGTWTITMPAGQNYAGGLTFTPPADSDIDMTGMTLTATATQPGNGDTATDSESTQIIVDAVADMPALNVNNANGLEGQSIALNISDALTDTDGSETLGNVTISGLPSGFSLNQGTDLGGGVWEVSQAQLTGLSLNTPSNFSGSVPLQVSVTSTESVTDSDFNLTNNTATNTQTLNVVIADTANPPTLDVDGTHQVLEDGSVFVPFSATITGDNTEILTVSVTGIDPTWSITNGDGTYNAATGTWTITMPAGQDYTGGITFTPPADSDVDLSGLNVTASVFAPATNTSSSITEVIQIIVDAVADAPDIDAGANGNVVAGNSVALNITDALTDTDGSETLGNVTIAGLPAGYSLNHGRQVSPGVWEVSQADLVGLQLNTPVNGNGNVSLTVSVTSTESVTDNDFNLTNNTATSTDTVVISVTPDNQPPSVTFGANGSGSAQVLEDGSVLVPISASLNGTTPQQLTVEVSGIPSSWTLSHLAGGTYNAATGTWTITMPAGQDFANSLRFTPPADSDVDLTGLTVTATSTNTGTGVTSSTSTNGTIIVDAVADMPTLNAANASGEEGTAINLNITDALTDTDGSETLGNVTISGLPNGATLNHGTNIGGGVWEVSQADLAGLQVNVPNGQTGTFNLSVSVTSTESVTDNDFNLTNNTATNTTNLRLVVGADDVPIITQPSVVTSREQDLTNTNVINGQITADFGSDAAGSEFCIPSGGVFSSTGAMTGGNLSSGGVAVNVTVVGGKYVGKAGGVSVFELQVNDDGSYTFKQFGPLDHASSTNPNEIINLNFAICAKDGDGDVSVTTLTVRVQDTGPIAKDDAVTLWSCDWATIGNVVTNHNQDGNGKDQLSVEGPNEITSVKFNGETFDFVVDGSKAMFVMGDHGGLYIFTDGSYAYISSESSPNSSHSERFSYAITDGDGDVSSANLDISVRKVTQTQNDRSDYAEGVTNTVIDGENAYQTSHTDGAQVFGWTANDVLSGNSGNDALYGWTGNDTLYGQAGNDLLIGEQGSNTLHGGSGSDVFAIHGDHKNNNNIVDTIKDFSLAEGDMISLDSVISGFNATDDINDFVRITMVGNDAMIQVNTDGNGNDFYNVARIEGHSGLDATTLNVQDLYDQGYIDVY